MSTTSHRGARTLPDEREERRREETSGEERAVESRAASIRVSGAASVLVPGQTYRARHRAKSSQVKSSQVKSSQVKSSQVKPSQAKSRNHDYIDLI